MRRDLVGAALVLRLLLELGALVVAAWWGWRYGGLLLAVAAVVAIIAVWGLFLSPRATLRLPWPVRAAIELVVWLATLTALLHVGQPTLAAVAAGVLLVDLAVLVWAGEWQRPGSGLALR